MTDATYPMTQSALKSVTREYLRGLGGTISEDGNRWHVRLPAHVDVEFTDGHEFDIGLDDEESADSDDLYLLTPESEFTKQVLNEVTEIATVGQVSLTDEDVSNDYRYPSWVTESEVHVDDATFYPYYDKTAICMFVRIGVETVSEYQTQFLEAITLDVESEEHLPGVAEILLSEFYIPRVSPPDEVSEEVSISPNKLASAVATGQKLAFKEATDKIGAIRESASRAADLEFEEYRQLQEQRIGDIQNEIRSLSNRIQTSAANVDQAPSRQERVNALEKRREFKEKKVASENDLSDILQEKENGYAEKQREIYERHAIEVKTQPAALTFVTYERGELELTLSESCRTASIRVPYAIGRGVTDEINCSNCHERMSKMNQVCVSRDGIRCRNCQ